MSFYKRFLLFSGQHYYPRGGFGDFVKSFDTIEEAKTYQEKNRSLDEWFEIVDAETGEIENG